MSKDFERECTKQCGSQVHGMDIVATITKRAVSDHAIASYIKRLCYNFNTVHDDQGRTAIHMAATQGRTLLLEWLVRNSPEIIVNAKDKESGYTALHKSIFYGQIGSAVKLLQLGVNNKKLDRNGFSALELAKFDRLYINQIQDIMRNPGSSPWEVYVWGSNSNYTLGIGAKQRINPDVISFFNKPSTQVKQVSLSKYHTVFLTKDGRVWACGQIGRAGADLETSIQPVELKLADRCVGVGALLDSTIFRLKNGNVLHYILDKEAILNPSKQTPTSITLPLIKSTMKVYSANGMSTSRVHAVIWTTKNVYLWGENNGQLGVAKTIKYVKNPNKIVFSSVKLVATSESATVVYADSTITLLHNYQTRTILSRIMDLKHICVQAKIKENGDYSRVVIIMVTSEGYLKMWQDRVKNIHKVSFVTHVTHQINVRDAILLNYTLYFTTSEGEAWSVRVPKLKQTTDKKDDNQHSWVVLKPLRIPNLNRAVHLFADDEQLNFACVQVRPECGVPINETVSSSRMYADLKEFLEQASVEDLLHDFVFKIGSRIYPSHIYIVAQSSDYIHDWYKERKSAEPNEIPVMELNDILPEVFEQVLCYLYTGGCDVLTSGNNKLMVKKDIDLSNCDEVIELREEILSQADTKSIRKRARNRQKSMELSDKIIYHNPVKLVSDAATKLKIPRLRHMLMSVYYNQQTNLIQINEDKFCQSPPQFSKSLFPELCDAFLRSKDGTLIPVHKCVLAARLPYFNSMFSFSFVESKKKSTITLPIHTKILIIIVDYLYSDVCIEIENSDSIEFLCSILIAADLILAKRLIEKCEICLIKQVNLKNYTDLLLIAHTYNANNLKKYCLDFISFNLVQVLESRALEVLDDVLLKDISRAYAELNPVMAYRVLTPFPNAVSDEVVNEIHRNYPVDLNAKLETWKSDGPKYDNCRRGCFPNRNNTNGDLIQFGPPDTSLNSPDSKEHKADVTAPKKLITEIKQENKWIEVPTAQQKLIQARLRAINSAKDIQNEVLTESFVKLSPATSLSESPDKAKLSMSPVESQFDPPKSSQGNITINHIGPKLSQKQRKKLAQQNGTSSLEESNNSYSPPMPVNPWKLPQKPQPSCSTDLKPITQSLHFNEILADQKRQKDNSTRIMSKPLHLTQLEDRAIEELEKFYNVQESDEEYITVRRIHVQISAPQWVHNSPK